MLESETGKNLLMLAAGLEVVGAFLIVKFSTIGEF
jgi:hypothetical protein